MKRILLFIICFVAAISVQAQKAKLTGKVTNVKNDVLASVTVTLKSDKSQVTKTDIECTNGVIHVIDTVILPA